MEKHDLEALKSSPLFNLSLSSKELFHSNFIAWLCDNYKELMSEIFVKFIKTNLEHVIIEGITQREYKNIDLTISFNNKETLYIENKVKSLPSIEQLRRYKTKIRKIDPNSHFLLLSLYKPNYKIDDDVEFLSYTDLSNELDKISDRINTGYHKELIKDYIKFIRSLSLLSSEFDINLETDRFDFYENLPEFKKIRIHDLYLKNKCEQISGLLYMEMTSKKLRNDISVKRNISPNKVERNKNVIVINNGMVKGKGWISVAYYDKKNYGLIVALDGMSYLSGIINKNNYGKKNLKAVFNKLDATGKWFTFTRLKKFIISPKRKVKDIKTFEKGQYLYKSVKLDSNIKIRELIDVIISDTAKMRKLMNKMK